MNYEEKYEQALERARECMKDGGISQNTIDYLCNIFPELNESEDERIRKELITHCRNTRCVTEEGAEGIAKWIAWLEKQGEQKNKINSCKFTFEDVLALECSMKTAKITKGGDELYKILVPLYNKIHNAYLLEKQGEQNIADKAESKFHEGDWVILTAGELSTILQIVKVATKKKLYWFNDSSYLPIVDEECLRLWSIQDAKDGDVVVDKSDGTIGIFQSIGHHPDGGSYDDPSYCFLHCRYDDGLFYADFEYGNTMNSDDVIPATKEQRELLFAKMKEAGYEWDADTKELKKIEQSELTEFEEEDEKIRKVLIDYFNRYKGQEECGINTFFEIPTDNILAWLEKQEKQNPTWSEEDIRNIENIDAVLFYDKDLPEDTCMRLRNWLKSLKNRIGG